MRRHLALFVLVAGCGVAGCSSDSGSAPTTVPAATSAPTSSTATVSTGFFGGAETAACAADLDQMETVVESYLALNGGTEVTEAELVQQGLLREESTLHDIGPGATVIPSPSGGCVS